MNAIEIAWQIVDSMVGDYDYKEDAIDELGDLDVLALRIANVIEDKGLHDETDLVYLQSVVDMELF